MILRLIILAVVLWIVVRALRAYLRAGKSTLSKHRDPRSLQGEDMVLDPQCQSYVPKGNALVHDGKYFCSQKCAALHSSR